MIPNAEPAIDSRTIGWRFDNGYARLPAAFFEKAQPMKVRAPKVAILNMRLGAELGLRLDAVRESTAALIFSGQELPDGAEPIAQAYAGHQFGGFTILGDGRAILLGEHITPSGERFDIQFKGSGPTAYSRRGDGKAALGPMLREYIISEAMAALRIPTTRSLAVVTTGEPVYRMLPQPGAMLTRVASSHIRVGTFQYFAARRDTENLRRLADYTIERHYPELVTSADRYFAFFRAVMVRQAKLIARWQMVGFIHGVMNTDNMAISGETIDYGPCAFMDRYHPDTVFSSIDQDGRYAYANQPIIAQWNLARFAETLLSLMDEQPERAVERATAALHELPEIYQQEWLMGMRQKLGFQHEYAEDAQLIDDLLQWMQASEADFTNTFAALSIDSPGAVIPAADETGIAWRDRWYARLDREGDRSSAFARMQLVNPTMIPRNHRVEEALKAAEEQGDFKVMHRLLEALADPYSRDPKFQEYHQPAPPSASPYRTFCGT